MKKICFSKFFITFLMALLCFGLVGCGDDEGKKQPNKPSYNRPSDDEEEEEVQALDCVVYFHYQRKDSNYNGWQIWLWDNQGEAGGALDPDASLTDSFGVCFKVDISDPAGEFYGVSNFGYIYRYGEWIKKDEYGSDRLVTITEDMIDENKEVHLYSFEGVEAIYIDSERETPVYEITTFMLDVDYAGNPTTVVVGANALCHYTVYCNGEVLADRDLISKTDTVPLNKAYSLSSGDIYELECTFENGKVLTAPLNIAKYYETTEFLTNYIYNGNDLGVTVKDGKTTFKLWAPASYNVLVELFNYGHPKKLGNEKHPGDNVPFKTEELTYQGNGVWSVTIDEDLTGKYYTYTVNNGLEYVYDIADPYATATGLNGLRSYIVDLDKLNPEGWEENRMSLYDPTELVVYELHIRDLTMDDTWNGKEENRGKYLGMSETGTTYTVNGKTVTTGFDHIKELGVNAVQILPFFDAANKETREDQYNWGYNPSTYNVLEGQYSSDPYDAEARIKEFKQMVKAYNDAGIEIIMDVVYNHMSGITGSSFHKILPGYYFRYTSDGKASNGSDCGNEVATEKVMVRNFIVNSVKFWAQEYNIKGFRFDLMGLIDTDTMNAVTTALKAIDSRIVVYGEPWGGFSASTLGDYRKTTAANASKVPNVGMFSDGYRNSVKGEAGKTTPGWVQGSGNLGDIEWGLKGLKVNSNPKQQVSYITCHDNYTLADRLRISGVSESQLGDASVVSNGLILTSQGITFIHAGAELLRSKPIYMNGIWTGEYSHNSYNLPDTSNSIKWEDKVKYAKVYEAYKDLVEVAKQPAFHFSTKAEIDANYNLKYSDGNCIFVEIKVPTGNWSKVTVLYTSGSGNNINYDLAGDWKVAAASGANNYAKGQTVNGTVNLGAYSIVVLYQER